MIKHYAKPILEKVMHEMSTGISLVKECSLSVITACGEKMGEEFKAFSPTLVPILMKVVSTYNQKEYK